MVNPIEKNRITMYINSFTEGTKKTFSKKMNNKKVMKKKKKGRKKNE